MRRAVPWGGKRKPLCGHVQLAKRYVNAHALVDVSLSLVLDQPERNGASAQKVVDTCIIIGTPTVVEKGVCAWQISHHRPLH